MSIATVCSVAAMVLPSGVFNTTMPRAVAAGISMLSTPTPARPITFKLVAASINSLVTWIWLRLTSASYSPMILHSSGTGILGITSTSKCSRSKATPFSLTSLLTKTLKAIF